MDVLEAMGTAVSMRWLKRDPVPDELVDRVLWAATRASNPGNSQPWDFVVVREEGVRRDVSGMMTGRLGAGLGRRSDDGDRTQEIADPTFRRIMAGVVNLLETMEDVPVLIFVCGRNVYPPNEPQKPMMYSAAYGAAQNLLVAARSLGLGAAYTTFHQAVEADIKHRLGMPEDVEICVTMPLGWPDRPFGTMKRRPMAEVVHHDRW